MPSVSDIEYPIVRFICLRDLKGAANEGKRRAAMQPSGKRDGTMRLRFMLAAKAKRDVMLWSLQPCACKVVEPEDTGRHFQKYRDIK
jgi:hypothetical protein